MARKTTIRRSLQFATRAIHIGQEPEPATGAVTVPIYQTSTYAQTAPGVHKGYDYSRTDNPTRTALQKALASLEEAQYALAFASGMGAATTAMLLFKLVKLIAGKRLAKFRNAALPGVEGFALQQAVDDWAAEALGRRNIAFARPQRNDAGLGEAIHGGLDDAAVRLLARLAGNCTNKVFHAGP